MDADALLPVLVAELADDDARRKVSELAQQRASAVVHLVDAPMDASLHVLEVMTPGFAEPLLVLAEPLGAPTERGFPLRLHPFGSPPTSRSIPPAGIVAVPDLRATRMRPATLSRRHTRDLLGDEAGLPESVRGAESLIGRTLAGKLIVEAEVGVGGMGAVYRARHKQLGTTIAVKVLHERFRSDLQFCARFHAEALVISQLDHPNVVRINDYGQEPDGLLYLAMDFLEGIELTTLLEREGTLPLPRIVDIAMQAAAGLGHAHARNIVHRDVKPTNIVLVKSDDDEGQPIDLVKVCDFGIAARSGTSALLGTPQYMSPEQCRGGEVDGRSDVYALGIILYELATGQLPFSSDDAKHVLHMQQHEPPPPLARVRPGVDARLEALVLRMLAKDEARRPQTMRDLRTELRDLTKPPSLQLFDVGAGSETRNSGPPRGMSEPPPVPPLGDDDDDSLPPVLAPTLARAEPKPRPPAAPDIPGYAARLAREPVSTLRETLQTPERLLAEAQLVAGAMQHLLAAGELAALAHVIALFRKVASTADPAGDPRAELSARLVRTMQDPARLQPVAERALELHDDAASSLLAGLGLAAAHALYNARLRVHPTPSARARFVAGLHAIGPASWQLVSAALERDMPGDTAVRDQRLADDLLRALPLGRKDDALGAIVAKYLRWGDPGVRRAAFPALVGLWGDRARPLLLAALLKDPDEGVRVAAVRGLRELRAIDDHVVRKADEILADAAPANASVRLAVVEALMEATADARPLAAAVLHRALAPRSGLLSRLVKGAPVAARATQGPLFIAMARSYVAIGGEGAPKVVEDFGRQCEEPLRTQLLGLVGARA